MTLKEKFRPLVWFNSGSFNVPQNREKDENSIKCEQIANEYAIEFAEWCGLRTVQITKSEWANWLPNPNGSLSTKELLEIFKKEKGL